MNRQEIISSMLAENKSLKQIGYTLGVSRQRVYQLLTMYQIETPEKQQHGFWKTQTKAQQWLWRILCARQLDRKIRFELYDKLKATLPVTCPILGLTLNYNRIGSGEQRDEDSPSLDRWDSDLPYQEGNLHIISWRANRIKNDGTAEEHKKIYEYLTNNTCAV